MAQMPVFVKLANRSRKRSHRDASLLHSRRRPSLPTMMKPDGKLRPHSLALELCADETSYFCYPSRLASSPLAVTQAFMSSQRVLTSQHVSDVSFERQPTLRSRSLTCVDGPTPWTTPSPACIDPIPAHERVTPPQPQLLPPPKPERASIGLERGQERVARCAPDVQGCRKTGYGGGFGLGLMNRLTAILLWMKKKAGCGRGRRYIYLREAT
ncbi:hypothetical protein BDY17DRAFT_292198 [Neohortaea acidophila]|uniref:Uncharacterized protein n=1 Tax=Neohortaea acidophila TaxID=245834 RepID=A0A6A6Q463_9PEZI|nr:uncharacterized protein BDY17DRAFT_292198 [Neohortaea acidophila]KAF2486841.1 hypothetical protein BDY17DRAFT_292198 [Neohortaea acidophila]